MGKKVTQRKKVRVPLVTKRSTWEILNSRKEARAIAEIIEIIKGQDLIDIGEDWGNAGDDTDIPF